MAANSAVRKTDSHRYDILLTQENMNRVLKAPQTLARVLHYQNRVSAATQSSFPISYSVSSLKRKWGNAAIILPIVEGLCGKCMGMFV